MKPFKLATLIMAVALATSSFSKPLDASSTESLLDTIPIIKLGDNELKSFYVEGSLQQGPITLNFEIAAQLPNDISMIISDQNATPILIAKNNEVGVYDAVSGDLITASLLPIFTMRVESNNFNMGIALMREKPDSNENASSKKRVITIDIPSILKTAEGRITAVQKNNGSYEIIGKSKKGNSIIIQMNDSEITRLQMLEQGKSNPMLSLNSIVLNEPIPSDYFIFPIQSHEEQTIICSKIKGTSDQNIQELMGLFFMGNMTLESDDAIYKKQLEQMLHIDINLKKNEGIQTHIL